MRDLAGLRALVVEDEGSVAYLLEDMLQELGCEIARSVATLRGAVRAAREDAFDFAVLDVNLDGDLVFPVADVLMERGLPFLFSTGYGQGSLPPRFGDRQVLAKPFSLVELRHKLRLSLADAPR